LIKACNLWPEYGSGKLICYFCVLNLLENADLSDNINNYINSDRHDFDRHSLTESEVAEQPMAQFEQWFQEVLDKKIDEPYAFTLATANQDGQPSARVVYMREFDEHGLICYSNYHSQKGRDISENPNFSANFYWRELERQVRFSGRVKKLDEKTSDEYFASRPRESQLGAWASDQSSQINNREALTQKFKSLKKKYDGREIPRPQHWGGYLLKPETVEFWQGRPGRLHDRLEYTTNDGKNWKLKRLSP
jgi:pyridoxamine 5'-phosphate oxidase